MLSGRRPGGGVGVGLRPLWNTSFQLDLKLIQRKKVEGQSTTFGYTGRALNNVGGGALTSQSMEWRLLQLCNMVALGMRLRQETEF